VGCGLVLTAVILDDHSAVTAGVEAWCTAADPLIRLIDAGDRLVHVWTEPGRSADVVIFDLQLGGRPPAFHDLRQLVKAGRTVIVYSQRADNATALTCLDLGAFTYLTKAEGKAHLIPAIHAAAHQLPYTSPSLSGALGTDDRPTGPISALGRLRSCWPGSNAHRRSSSQPSSLSRSRPWRPTSTGSGSSTPQPAGTRPPKQPCTNAPCRTASLICPDQSGLIRTASSLQRVWVRGDHRTASPAQPIYSIDQELTEVDVVRPGAFLRDMPEKISSQANLRDRISHVPDKEETHERDHHDHRAGHRTGRGFWSSASGFCCVDLLGRCRHATSV